MLESLTSSDLCDSLNVLGEDEGQEHVMLGPRAHTSTNT